MADIGKIQPREISEEMRESYLDYAMSVIVSRALPDVRDGLKPVHRRILYAMHEMGLRHDAKLVKSARIVGNTLAYYHPHGDIAVYDALVRLAQPFSLRYPLVQGQGNFGSIDGDSPAAQRYTESRLTAIAEGMLADLEKETVDWQPNYDATRQEPKVLPSKIPNLLLNGSLGIAVGMATNIPPHNLNEVILASKHLLRNPNATTEDLMQFIQGPDFPTGGIIYDRKSIIEAYSSGRGPILCRGKAEIVERKKGGWDILITEIPYEVNKSELVSRIAELAEEKKIAGIRDIRDESDKEGLRIVVELKGDAQPERVLNQIYKLTDLEKTFHLNALALIDGLQPQTLSLHALLGEYIKHRKTVVLRRTKFDLEKTKERIHILEGLAKALSQIDDVVKTIKASENRELAKNNLIKKFSLSEKQAEAILAMRLESLARLEREKILTELKEKGKLKEALEAILKNPKKVIGVIEEEFDEISKKFGNPRKTEVEPHPLGEILEEELIPEEEIIITLSQANYIKRLAPDSFRLQRRGGRGVIGFEARAEDDTLKLVTSANTHDTLLLFSNLGRVFQVRAYEISEGSRASRGKPIQNFLNVLPQEEIVAIVNYRENRARAPKGFFILATKNGIIKKTPAEDFRGLRRGGMRAILLKKGDSLRWASLSSGEDEIILVSSLGQAIRFKESQIRPMGRASAGIAGQRLKKEDEIVGMGIIGKLDKDAKVLVVTKNGFGKLTPIKDYRLQNRAGSGIKTAKIQEKNGPIIAAMVVRDEEELIAASKSGQTIRVELLSLPTQARATQGVRVMKLGENDFLVAATAA